MGQPKDKPRKTCGYCGASPAPEQEHVIARNLFPKPRPAMITIPACGKCNDEKKPYDDDLRDMMTIDIENDRHAVTGTDL